MAKRFHAQYFSDRNFVYNIEIWDTAFSGTSTLFEAGAGSFALTMQGEGQEMLNHISATDCRFDMMRQNATHDALLTDLQEAEEGRFTVKISRGATSPTPVWYGMILPDIGNHAEEYYPSRFTVKATDGIGILKKIDFNNDGVAYTGKARKLDMLKNALKKLPYVATHWGASDNFIATVLDLWEETMDKSGTDPCMLYQSYHDYSVWQKYDKGEEQYTSCYDVIKNIMISSGARITQWNGTFWVEHLFYRAESTVVVRTYTRDGGLSSTDNLSEINDINQTVGGALLAVAEYEFFPGLKEVNLTFMSRLRRNFLEDNSGDISTLTTIYKPIDNNGGTATLRISGNINFTISSKFPNALNPFPPLVVIFRLEINLGANKISRDYSLLPTFQIQYSPMLWGTGLSDAIFIGFPINNPYFLLNAGTSSFSFSQIFDEISPLIPDKVDDFQVRFTLHEIRDFAGGAYSLTDFDVDYEFSNRWIEVYTNGTPKLSEDEAFYKVGNDINTTNSGVIEYETVLGTSDDPNALGAIWVKPGADYQLAGNWGIGADTATRRIEYFLVELTLSGQYSPTEKIQGTIFGDLERLARFFWNDKYWIFLGGTWDSDREEITGEWVEFKFDQDFNCSPPKKRKAILTSITIPPASTSSGQGGASYELVAKPPGTLFYPVALTTTSVALVAGSVTTVPISEVLTDGDVYDGDTVVILDPITGTYDELTVTATSLAGQTSIAVTGTLTTKYPANAPIIKKPKIGTFSLPEGVLGDLLKHNGTKWAAWNKGSALQLLRVNAAGTDLEWFTFSGGTGTITGTLTETRIPFATTPSELSDDEKLTWDNAAKSLVIGTGTAVALLNIFGDTGSTSTEFLRMSANISNNMIAYLLNANNTTTAANAFFSIGVGGASAGDPFIQFVVSGQNTWAVGIDNSTADSFKISKESTPGASTGTDFLVIGTDGRASMGGGALVEAVNLYLYGNGGVRLPSGTTAQQPAVAQNIIRNNSDFGGIEVKNISGSWKRLTCTSAPASTIPAANFGTGAGTSPSGTVSGNDLGGDLSFTVGASPAPGANVVTVEFGSAFSTVPVVTISPRNAAAAAAMTNIYISSGGPLGFTLRSVGSLSTGQHIFSYQVTNG